jgi:predicted dehydrogenase
LNRFSVGQQAAEAGLSRAFANVAQLVAAPVVDIVESTHAAPSFEEAVALHRVVAAIEEAAENGVRISPA